MFLEQKIINAGKAAFVPSFPLQAEGAFLWQVPMGQLN